MTLLDTALNYPLETLCSHISPRLYNSINQINQHSPETATKFRNLEQAFTLHDSSLESTQFWQAYRQYQEDAFYEMRVQPCIHPANHKLPCVRPNYSQLFYQFKPQAPGPAVLGQGSRHQRHPAAGVAERHSHPARTDGPLRPALAGPAGQQGRQRREGAADGKPPGRAGPQYSLSIIYPNISIGSVSPAWLAITADSGLKGDTLLIGNQRHVLLTGSPLLAQQMTMAQIP